MQVLQLVFGDVRESDGMQSVTNESVLQMYDVTSVKGVGNKINWTNKIKIKWAKEFSQIINSV